MMCEIRRLSLNVLITTCAHMIQSSCYCNVKQIPNIIDTTLCKMQQIYYIHNVVQMQLIFNVGRWRHSTHQKCYC